MSLEQLLTGVEDVKFLSIEEERELFNKAKQGDEDAKNRLAKANIPRIIKLAKKYARSSVYDGAKDSYHHNRDLVLEYIQAGFVGLSQAFVKFKIKGKAQFRTYLHVSIINAMNNEYWRRVKEFEVKRNQIMPSQFDDSDGDSFWDRTENEKSPVPGNLATNRDLKDYILLHINQIQHPRQREVLLFNFGLDGQVPYTLKEIGDYWGVTRERSRQFKEEALDALRDIMLDPR